MPRMLLSNPVPTVFPYPGLFWGSQRFTRKQKSESTAFIRPLFWGVAQGTYSKPKPSPL